MAQMTIYPSSGPISGKSGNPHIVLDYTIANGSFTVNSITGYRNTYKNWDAVNKATVKVNVPGGTITLYSTTGASWSDGVGYRESGFTWSLTGTKTISTSGTGNVSVVVSGTSSSSECNGTFSGDSVNVPPAYTAPTVNSWSCSLIPNIINLRSRITHNITKNTNNIWAENEIDIDKDNGQCVKQTYIYENRGSSYNATHDLTITGAELKDSNDTGTSVLGKTVYSNLEIWDGGSFNEDTRFSSGWTVPSNLYSIPSDAPLPSVKKITATNITFQCSNCPNWIRNETQAYYQYDIEFFKAGSRVGRKELYGQTHASVSPGEQTFKIGVAQSGGTFVDDPTTETVSAGSAYNYNLIRGAYYIVGTKAHTKFLGVARTQDGSSGLGVYIPYLPTLTKNSFTYKWSNEDGGIYYRLVKANITLSNPNNEDVGPRYLAFSDEKEAISSLNGNEWIGHTTSTKLRYKYINQAVTLTAKAKMYYAQNGWGYSENTVDPVVITDSVTLPAEKTYCSIGTPAIDVFGKLSVPNVTFNVPDTNLPIGTTLKATLQLSKSNDFSTITHSQTKNVTKWGNNGKLFDDIELLGSDLGTNYIRVVWHLHTSSNYYGYSDLNSATKSIEFTGIIPEIDEFTGYVNYADGKIKCKIKESTGVPKPKLYLDVYRVSGGGVYQSFEVTNNTEYTLPYTEPGTIWYVRARAVNALGTVYAKDSSNNVIEYTYQIPYTTTEDYDSKAKPTISAGKILYNQNCTMNFTWTNIVTNVDHVQYNIKVRSTNAPITPVDHNNKISGYNYTFAKRKDDEKVMFVLEVVLLNSFNEAVVTYLIDSNEITLDALDLGKQGFTYHTNTTYHSIKYILDTFDKNTTSAGDDNKLVQMSVELFDKATGASVERYFIGDENPTMHSLDLTPIPNYMFEDLKANHTYKLVIDTLCVNPLDLSKKHRVKVEADVNTNDFNVYPVKNLQVNITKQIQNKPTANSNVELKWDTPNKGDADVVDYIVSYRKNSVPYTDIIVVERQYTLAHEIVPINNDDEIYIKVGARYLDWFGNYQTKWINLPVITAASTNYIYYECSYPNVEQSKRRMYKIAESQTSESLVRNVHINK